MLDLLLDEITARSPWAVMANVLGSSRDDLAAGLATVGAFDAGTKVQLYGTAVRSRRKLGHTTVMGDDLGEVRARALAAIPGGRRTAAAARARSDRMER